MRNVLIAAIFVFVFGSVSAHFSPSSIFDIVPESLKATLKCDECEIALKALTTAVELNATKEEIIKIAQGFCIFFNIEDKTVCDGIILMYQAELFDMIKWEVDNGGACGYVGWCPKPVQPVYNVTFPKPKPPHVDPVPPTPGMPQLKILQITDLHFDIYYQQGMLSQCDEPLCCRAHNGPGTNASNTAGKWGDYNCDLNMDLLMNLLVHLNTTVQPDIIFWTGDNPPHDVWNQSKAGQIANSQMLTTFIKETFPGTPVYPTIGNHEGVPVNQYMLPPGESWLYDAMGDMWAEWITDATAMATFRYSGYYVMNLRPGVRIMSINTNYCANQNYWILKNTTDPAGMLEWMVKELQAAEDVGDHVYIIGHIPSGDCLGAWGMNFVNIVDRYEDTIIVSFFGHSHDDELEIYYEVSPVDPTQPRAVHFSLQTPSVTTYTYLNPSYRVYTVDAKSMYLIEASTYHCNLTEANLNDNPVWVLEYNATTTYNLTNMFPADYGQLVEEFKQGKFIQEYYSFVTSGGPGRSPICDAGCQAGTICGLYGADPLQKACYGQQGARAQAYLQSLPAKKC